MAEPSDAPPPETNDVKHSTSYEQQHIANLIRSSNSKRLNWEEYRDKNKKALEELREASGAGKEEEAQRKKYREQLDQEREERMKMMEAKKKRKKRKKDKDKKGKKKSKKHKRDDDSNNSDKISKKIKTKMQDKTPSPKKQK